MNSNLHHLIDRTLKLAIVSLIVALLAVSTHQPSTAAATTPTHVAPRVAWSAPVIATWYGPGYYGHTFACPGAGTYHQATRGVATNASGLPCGARVTLRYHGRAITVPVIDRCPGCDTSGHPFDLTARSDLDLCNCPRPYTLHGVRWHRG